MRKSSHINKDELQYKKAVIELITAAIVAMTAFLSLINEGKEVNNLIIIDNSNSQIVFINND